MKEKIAIAIEKELLKKIDSTVDGSSVRSRSQAIEMLVRKGMKNRDIDTAVILLSRKHQKIMRNPFKDSFLIDEQKRFFLDHGIKKIYAVCQSDIPEKTPQGIEFIETKAQGNAGSLRSIKNSVSGDFVAMSGNTYNRFDLSKMINAHVKHEKMATIGIMSHKKPDVHGIVMLDGNIITEFSEKPKNPKSNIVNAGIYVFRPEVLDMIENPSQSIEKDLLPQLAKARQLVGYFTMGEYHHVED